MPYIPPEVVEKAREMDLLTYLKSYEPQELVHFGSNTYCTREHDSLKISNGKWCWFSRGIGGYLALDYLIKIKEMPFTIDENIIEKFVSRITPIDNGHYRWDLNFTQNKKQAIIGSVEGRKGKATADIRTRPADAIEDSERVPRNLVAGAIKEYGEND